jgi:hypothetical protein
MVTIGYCYYNNHPEFQWVIDYYNNEMWNDFNFCVVDDGSSVELPKCDWTKIRIDHDYELWNNEGARNVMADFLDTGWILFMDVDFVLKDNSVMDILPSLDKTIAYFGHRNRPQPHQKVHPNLFLIHSDYFEDLGGYKLRGYCDNESLLKELNKDYLHELFFIDNPIKKTPKPKTHRQPGTEEYNAPR